MGAASPARVPIAPCYNFGMSIETDDVMYACKEGSTCLCHPSGMCDHCAVDCAETIVDVEIHAAIGGRGDLPEAEHDEVHLYGMTRMSELLDEFGAHEAARTVRNHVVVARVSVGA